MPGQLIAPSSCIVKVAFAAYIKEPPLRCCAVSFTHSSSFVPVLVDNTGVGDEQEDWVSVVNDSFIHEYRCANLGPFGSQYSCRDLPRFLC